MYSRIISFLVGIFLLFGSLMVLLELTVIPLNPFLFLFAVVIGSLGEYCIYKTFTRDIWYE